MATRKKSTRNGGSSERRAGLSRRAVLAGLGAGLAVPTLRADSEPASIAVLRSAKGCKSQLSISLDKYPTFNMAFEFDSEKKTLLVTTTAPD
jgi:hypothetical protein